VAPRHRSLAAALAWSHDLLAPNDRMALRRVSVFAGSFTLPRPPRWPGDDCDMVAAVESLTAKALVAHVRGAESTTGCSTPRAPSPRRSCTTAGRRATCPAPCGAPGRRAGRVEREARHQHSADWVAAHWPPRRRRARRARLGVLARGDRGWHRVDGVRDPAVDQLSAARRVPRRAERALAIGARQSHAGVRDRMQLARGLALATLYTRGPRPETDSAVEGRAARRRRRRRCRIPAAHLVGAVGYLVLRASTARHWATCAPAQRGTPARRCRRPAGRGAPDRDQPATTSAGRAAPARAWRRCCGRTPTRCSMRTSPASSSTTRRRCGARWPPCCGCKAWPTRRCASRTRRSRVRSREPPVSLAMRWGTTAIPIALYTGDLAAADALMLRSCARTLRQHALSVWCLPQPLPYCRAMISNRARATVACVDELAGLLGHAALHRDMALRQSFYSAALAPRPGAGGHGPGEARRDAGAIALRCCANQTAGNARYPARAASHHGRCCCGRTRESQAPREALFSASRWVLARRQGALVAGIARRRSAWAELWAMARRPRPAGPEALVDAVRAPVPIRPRASNGRPGVGPRGAGRRSARRRARRGAPINSRRDPETHATRYRDDRPLTFGCRAGGWPRVRRVFHGKMAPCGLPQVDHSDGLRPGVAICAQRSSPGSPKAAAPRTTFRILGIDQPGFKSRFREALINWREVLSA
jgi:hypothetical protein